MSPELQPPKTWVFIRLGWSALIGAVRQGWLVCCASVIGLALTKIAAAAATAALASVSSESWIVESGTTAAGLTLGLTRMALASLFLAPVVVTVTRLVVLDERPSSASAMRAPRWNVVAWVLGFQLFNAISALPSVIFGSAGTAPLMFLAAAGLGMMSLHSALVFPAVCTDEPGASIKDRVELSWARMSGLFWKMLFASLLVGLPFLLAALGAGRISATGSPPAAAHPSVVATGIASLISAVGEVGCIAAASAVASWMYLWALDHPRQPSARL